MTSSMKKRKQKKSLETIIYRIIIGLLLIALIVVYYLGFVKDTEEQNTTDVANSASATVPTSELVTLYYEADNRIFYAYIEDGDLYYFNERNKSFVDSSNAQKYEGLSNITRMETYNLGAGVNPVPFLITEEGQVYYIDVYADDGIKVELYEGLEGYEVEDIISHTGEMDSVFEILLKDGTTKTVEEKFAGWDSADSSEKTEAEGKAEVATETEGPILDDGVDEVVVYEFDTYDDVHVILDESNIYQQTKLDGIGDYGDVQLEQIAPGKDIGYYFDGEMYYIKDYYRNLLTISKPMSDD